MAPRDIAGGEAYATAILKAIETARTLVVLISGHANNSAFVAREVERAASLDIPILAIRIEDVMPAKSLELFVSFTQWINAHDRSWEETLAQVEAALVDRTTFRQLPTYSAPHTRRTYATRAIAISFVAFIIAALAFLTTWGNPTIKPSLSAGEVATAFFSKLANEPSAQGLDDMLDPVARASTTQAQMNAGIENMAARLQGRKESSRIIYMNTATGRDLQSPPGEYSLVWLESPMPNGKFACQSAILRQTSRNSQPEWKIAWANAWAPLEDPCVSQPAISQAASEARKVLDVILRSDAVEPEMFDATFAAVATPETLNSMAGTLRRLVGEKPSIHMLLAMPSGGIPLPGGGSARYVMVRFAIDGAAQRFNADIWMVETGKSPKGWTPRMFPDIKPWH